MARFVLTRPPSGRDLGAVDARTGTRAIEKCRVKHPDRGMQAGQYGG